jgi:hypothetical protein
MVKKSMSVFKTQKNPCRGFSEASENTFRIAGNLCNLLFGFPLRMRCSPPLFA